MPISQRHLDALLVLGSWRPDAPKSEFEKHSAKMPLWREVRVLERCRHLNVLGPDEWDAVARRMTQRELVDLFRGLVRAETIWDRGGGWSGGSVAANIWVFGHLWNKLERQEYERLYDWAISNRGTNDWTPGSRMCFF
jgi:hypothetical protein